MRCRVLIALANRTLRRLLTPRANMNAPIRHLIVPHENQSEDTLFQGSPELFSPSVMRKREKFWSRDCDKLIYPKVTRANLEKLNFNICSMGSSPLIVFPMV